MSDATVTPESTTTAGATGTTTPPPSQNTGGATGTTTNTGNGPSSGAATTGSSTGTTQTTPPTQTQVAADWIAGIKNEETRGYVQKKGFKDPELLADSYRNLEKLMGVPKEQILKLPEKFDSPEGEQVWQRLGKPEKPEGYGIEASKDAPLQDKEFTEWAKNAFHKSNLTSDQAKNLLNEWNQLQTTAGQKQNDAFLAQSKSSSEALKAEWGNAYDVNLNKAQAAVRELGISPNEVNGMEKAIGYEKTMKLFSSLGSKVGESAFVNGIPRTGNGPMDVNTARATLANKKADVGFMAKYLAGDAAAKAEMGALFKDAHPGEFSV